MVRNRLVKGMKKWTAVLLVVLMIAGTVPLSMLAADAMPGYTYNYGDAPITFFEGSAPDTQWNDETSAYAPGMFGFVGDNASEDDVFGVEDDFYFKYDKANGEVSFWDAILSTYRVLGVEDVDARQGVFVFNTVPDSTLVDIDYFYYDTNSGASHSSDGHSSTTDAVTVRVGDVLTFDIDGTPAAAGTTRYGLDIYRDGSLVRTIDITDHVDGSYRYVLQASDFASGSQSSERMEFGFKISAVTALNSSFIASVNVTNFNLYPGVSASLLQDFASHVTFSTTSKDERTEYMMFLGMDYSVADDFDIESVNKQENWHPDSVLYINKQLNTLTVNTDDNVAGVEGWQTVDSTFSPLAFEQADNVYTTEAVTDGTVKLLFSPAEKYEVVKVALAYNNGYTKTLTADEDGYYSFKMPDFPATVTVTTALVEDYSDYKLEIDPPEGTVSINEKFFPAKSIAVTLLDKYDNEVEFDEFTGKWYYSDSAAGPWTRIADTDVANGYQYIESNTAKTVYLKYVSTLPVGGTNLLKSGVYTLNINSNVNTLTVNTDEDVTGVQGWQTVDTSFNPITFTVAGNAYTATIGVGGTVQLLPATAEGYEVVRVTLSYNGGYTKELTANEDGYYIFDMPEFDATVTISTALIEDYIEYRLNIDPPEGTISVNERFFPAKSIEVTLRDSYDNEVEFDEFTGKWFYSDSAAGPWTRITDTDVANGYQYIESATAKTVYLKYVSTLPVDGTNFLKSGVYTLNIVAADYVGYKLDMDPTAAAVNVGDRYELKDVTLTLIDDEADVVDELEPRTDGQWCLVNPGDTGYPYLKITETDANGFPYIDTTLEKYGLDSFGVGTIKLVFISNLPVLTTSTDTKTLSGMLCTGVFELYVGIEGVSIKEYSDIPTLTFDDADAKDIALSTADDTIKLSDYIRVTKNTVSGGVTLTAGKDFEWHVSPSNGGVSLNGDVLTFVDDPFRVEFDGMSAYTYQVWAVTPGGAETEKLSVTVKASRAPQDVLVTNASDLFDEGDKGYYIYNDVSGNTFNLDTLNVSMVDQYGDVFNVTDARGARGGIGTAMVNDGTTYQFDWATNAGKLTWYVSKDGGAYEKLTAGSWTVSGAGTYSIYATIGSKSSASPYFTKFAQSDPITVEVKPSRTIADEAASVSIAYPEDHDYMTLYWDTTDLNTADLENKDVIITLKDQYGDDVAMKFKDDNTITLTFANGRTAAVTTANYGWTLGKTGVNRVASVTDNVITGEFVGKDVISFWITVNGVKLESSTLNYNVMSIETPYEFYYNGGADYIREGVAYNLYEELSDHLYVRDQYGNSQTLRQYVDPSDSMSDEALMTYLQAHLAWALKDGKATTVDGDYININYVESITEDGELRVENGAIGVGETKQLVVEATLDGLEAEHIWLYVREVQEAATVEIASPVDYVPLSENVNLSRFTLKVFDQYEELMYNISFADDSSVKATDYNGNEVSGITVEWSADGTYLTIEDGALIGSVESVQQSDGTYTGTLTATVKKDGTEIADGEANIPVYGVAKIVDVDVLNCWVWAKPGESLDLSTLNVVVYDQYGNAYTGKELDEFLATYEAEIRWGISNSDETDSYIKDGVLHFGEKTGTVVIACMVVNSIDFTLRRVEKPIPVQPDPPVVSKCVIEASAVGNGVIAPAGRFSVALGSNKSFVFTPNKGYKLIGVYVDGKLVDATESYTFTDIRSNHTIVAVFSDNQSHTAFVDGYGDGTFRPDGNMTRAEAVTIFARLLSGEMYLSKSYKSSFSDVEAGKWYSDYIGYLEGFGIIGGYEDGTFRPNNLITRAEFTAIVYRYAELTSKAIKTPFSDTASHWASNYINAVYAEGWINGYDNGTFGPDRNITRAEVVAIVCRMLDRTIDADSINGAVYSTYKDVSKSHWAYYYIIEASNDHGYAINEDGDEIWFKQ